jgi:ATP phosphoribosyltransferase regulatory subunit
LALRPDLTIPICRHQVESGAPLPARISYNGLAFRHQPGEPHRPTQFFQAGVELLGVEDRAAADSEILTLTVEGLRAAGLSSFEMKIGDLSLFGALVDALDMPVQWRARLKRHFWRIGYFEQLLEKLTAGTSANGSVAETRAVLEAKLDALGDAPRGGRTREEIVARLLDQNAAAAAIRLHPEIARVLTKFLAVSGSAAEALDYIRILAKDAGVSLDVPLAAMEARLATLKALGVDGSRLRFAARFGRNMEYYTGVVFELWARDAEGPVQIAGGGRYDMLLELLGAKRPAPAIGCAIRTERVLQACRTAEAK